MSRPVPRSRARLLLAVLLSAAVALLGLGVASPASAAPRAQISGTVTDAAGDPVKGITVTAYDDAGGVGQATTKSDGGYTIKKLGAGSYTLAFEDASKFPLYATQYYDGRGDPEDLTYVDVSAGQVVTGIDAVMARFATVSGTVTDEQGNPITDAGGGVYYSFLRYDPAGPPFTDYGGGQVSPSTGRYTYPFLPAGTYYVYFSTIDDSYLPELWQNASDLADATLLTVTPGEVVSDVDAELAPAPR